MAMVQYADGSVLAQLGTPDMRTPIAHMRSGFRERIEAVTVLGARPDGPSATEFRGA
jgi:1-deoxy-D-xylulose 5-phosphate reductoisomerase